MRSISTTTALAVMLGSVSLIGAGAAPAAADSSKTLPISSYADMAVDGLHQRVFISDPTRGSVVVTDYSGAVVGRIDSLPGATGLELSADSATVYAAVKKADAIVAIDTATLKESARYGTGTGTAPEHPALAGGKLWFGYSSNIGSIDLSAPEPVVTLGQDKLNTFFGTPMLASAPGAPGVLAAGIEWQSPQQLAVYDVSSGTAERTARTDSSAGGSMRDLALSPDGTHVVVASGSPYYHQVLRTSDLVEDGRYASDSYPNAVDIAPDGAVAAGISGWYSDDIYVYKAGAGKPVRTYDFPRTNPNASIPELQGAGLAWAPDRSRLFAVVAPVNNGFSLHVLEDPTKSASQVTVNAPSAAPRAKKLTVTGKLSSQVAFPAGGAVQVTRTDLETPAGKSLGSKPVAAGGTFSFTDVPPAGGKVTYTVRYAGDAEHAAATGADSVEVSRTATTLTLTGNGKNYKYGSKATFTAHLGATYKSRTLVIYAQPAEGTKKAVKTGTVDRSGNLSFPYTLTKNTTFTASFRGDARTAPKAVASKVGTHVKVAVGVTRHYKTAKVSGVTQYYFRKNTNPLFTTTMTAHKGRCQTFSLEVYSAGKWHDAGSQCFELSTAGRSAVELQGPHDTGFRLRMRSSYVKKSGDAVNATTHGSWVYFTFTR
ncbi:Ig-like domain repeat protein [Streptomyces sp. A3M-1-3]|uniref:YncE family protein n=1 Tax=Streptomyces sp. A3M-1-3 TaxID=2962044 RepID=UPI0020B72506|nr:Ig-like domain repeat protein [Streptomyces sp. A3M-1-3]MCP3818063.1 Ig-like domain repeat protein [Streptomyces sp. A3M-1-3]